MLRCQSDSLTKHTEDNQEAKMQLLTKAIACNVFKVNHTLQVYKVVSPYCGRIQFNLTSENNNRNEGLRNYATKPTQKLLRFPAPNLEETIKKYLYSVEPFLNSEELETNRKEVEVFLRCHAPKLQKLLEKAAAKEKNWLTDRWTRVAYLQYRDPVTIYSSPGMTFPPKEFCGDDDYLEYTAKCIYCLVKYKQLVDLNRIPIQKMGKFELDNSQFGMVLGTCRIPLPEEDKVQLNPTSTHVAVIYKNHFYKLSVFSKRAKPIHPKKLKEGLKKIMSCEKEDGTPFGLLTHDKRDNWAIAYKELMSIKGNKELVEIIQKSLFTVSLDGELCFDPCANKKNVLAELLIHGGGTKNYSGNRWMDKTIQLIVCKSGFQGFCYEHSPAEGQPIALLVDFITKNMDDKKLLADADDQAEPPTKLALKTSPELDKHILVAKNNLDKSTEDLHMHVLYFQDYGKGFLKMQKLSPDSFVQMGLQYAYYRLYKCPAAAYESAHHRIFYTGRTETIRSCSNESLAFCRAMYEPNSDEERVNRLRKAVNAHRAYTTMALEGKAVDRHLLGLKLMAMENKLPIPPFYNLPAFKRSTHFKLSTSQVASGYDAFMCYGTAFKDGYGVCYNPRENDIILSVSSWKSCEDTCSDRFAASLQEAFNEMSGVLCRAGAATQKNKL